VHPERFFLAERSIHVEDLNDDYLRLNLRNRKLATTGKPQMALSLRIIGHSELDWWKRIPYGWGLICGLSRTDH
ncbi:MAG: hypothetical protein ACERKR_10300, partial [Deltaproteobacteria bacterium]